MTCNLRYLLYSVNPISVPGSWVAYGAPDAFTIEADVNDLIIRWVPAYAPPHLLLYLSLPLRQSSLKLRRSLFYVGYDVAGGARDTKSFKAKFENLCNITWADFFNSANCHIIIRLLEGSFTTGYFGHFASNIIKIN